MFKWMKRFGGSAPGGAKARVGRGDVAQRQELVESLDDLIKTPGKASYKTLIELSATSTRDEFIYAVHCPAFVGSGIREGSLEKGIIGGAGKSQRTQVFSASQIAQLIEGASLDNCIFLLRKPMSGSVSDLKRFTLGRTQDNDILMMDYAISRCHAEVEIRGEDYYLKDLGSSNGTYVNGKEIDDRGTLLHDLDLVRFARYEFQFLSAGGLYDLMRARRIAEAAQGARPA